VSDSAMFQLYHGLNKLHFFMISSKS